MRPLFCQSPKEEEEERTMMLCSSPMEEEGGDIKKREETRSPSCRHVSYGKGGKERKKDQSGNLIPTRRGRGEKGERGSKWIRGKEKRRDTKKGRFIVTTLHCFPNREGKEKVDLCHSSSCLRGRRREQLQGGINSPHYSLS